MVEQAPEEPVRAAQRSIPLALADAGGDVGLVPRGAHEIRSLHERHRPVSPAGAERGLDRVVIESHSERRRGGGFQEVGGHGAGGDLAGGVHQAEHGLALAGGAGRHVGRRARCVGRAAVRVADHRTVDPGTLERGRERADLGVVVEAGVRIPDGHDPRLHDVARRLPSGALRERVTGAHQTEALVHHEAITVGLRDAHGSGSRTERCVSVGERREPPIDPGRERPQCSPRGEAVEVRRLHPPHVGPRHVRDREHQDAPRPLAALLRRGDAPRPGRHDHGEQREDQQPAREHHRECRPDGSAGPHPAHQGSSAASAGSRSRVRARRGRGIGWWRTRRSPPT